MVVDFLNLFSSEQVLSDSGADSTNTLDIGKAGLNEGQAYVFVRGLTALTGLTSVTLKGSADNTTYAEILTVKPTDLTIGGGCQFPLPQGLPRYLKLTYAGTSMSSVKVDAGITMHPDSPRGKRIGDYEANPNYAV